MHDSRRSTPAYSSSLGATSEPDEAEKMGWAAVIYVTLLACLVLVVTFAAVQSRLIPSRGDAPSGFSGP
jgi:hypothetical protein